MRSEQNVSFKSQLPAAIRCFKLSVCGDWCAFCCIKTSDLTIPTESIRIGSNCDRSCVPVALTTLGAAITQRVLRRFVIATTRLIRIHYTTTLRLLFGISRRPSPCYQSGTCQEANKGHDSDRAVYCSFCFHVLFCLLFVFISLNRR